MTISRQTFLANDQQLRDAMQIRSHHEGQFAYDPDDVVQGKLKFGHPVQGPMLLDVGRTNVDWQAHHITHQEWCAQLHRFRYMRDLASKFTETRDEQYAQAARDYYVDWMNTHPVADDGTWTMAPYDNTLNCGVRIELWLASLPELLESEAFADDALFERIITSAGAQFDYLDTHLADRINWRVHQASSMVRNAIRMAGEANSGAWLQRGVDAVNDAFHRQVMPDGCHYERNPSYHTGMVSHFEGMWRIGRAMPDIGIAIDTDSLARMHDYTLAVTRPDGNFCGIHDCHYEVPDGTVDDRWLKARRAFREEAGLDPDVMPPASRFFPDAGQAYLRTGWESDATYITFDATVWGGSHCHLSRNSVQVHPHGRPVIIDPGSLTYEGSDPFSHYGKSTPAHNTINFNRLNQATTDPTTHYQQLPGYEHVWSHYAGGYWPGRLLWGWPEGHGTGVYGEHHRNLLWVRDRFIIVIDHVFTSSPDDPPTIHCNWQLAAGPYELDADAGRAWTCDEGGNALMLFAQYPSHGRVEAHEGSEDPRAGWAPSPQGVKPAPMLSVVVPDQKVIDTHIVTVIVPFKGSAVPDVRVTDNVCPEDTSYGHIGLEWGDGEHAGERDDVFWTGRMEVALERKTCSFYTDAGLVHLKHDAEGALAGGLVAGGTFIDPYATERRAKAGSFLVG